MKPLNHYLSIPLLLFLIVFSGNIYSQENDTNKNEGDEITETKASIKPLRIGVKIGVPSIATLNAEYVTPLLNNRIAFTLDYFPFSANISDADVKLNNLEIGANIYISKKGKGLYFGAGYFNFDSKITNIIETEFDDGSVDSGKTAIEFSTINLKIGAKLGHTFYFRIEAGYGFGNLPDTIVITNNDGTQSVTEEIGDIGFLASSGVPIFNFGIGWSFL